MCEQIGFEPHSVFTRIDRKNRGFVTAKDFARFLISKNIQMSDTYGKCS
jgi:hypothetical protein